MRHGFGVAVVAALGLALTMGACKAKVEVGPQAALSPEQMAAQIERGRYLAIAGDCAACHTRPGGEAYAGGRGLETPFGVIYAPNITPDKTTGIGGWSTADFRRALHHGQDNEGKNLYPAFSYPYYARVANEDVDAIHAYLNSLAPISYTAPKNGLGFPFNIRLSLKGWNLLHFRSGVFRPVGGKSAEWNRGAYLVEGLGHCGACHTPKNIMGGDKNGQRLEGGVLEGWFASDLTNDKVTGLGNWTEQDIVDFLKTGANTHSSAYGGMAEVVRLSTSQMTDEDLKAMAVYLKSVPATAKRRTSAAPDPAVMAQGKAIYIKGCADCHVDDGTGIPGLYPPLAGNANVNAHDPSSILQITIDGSGHPDNPAPFGAGMASFPNLTNAEVAAVATYIRNSWGNKASPVIARQAGEMRALVNSRKKAE